MAKPTDVHHLYFPKSAYRTRLEKQYRDLPCNRVRLAISVHHNLHVYQGPPGKPEADVMWMAVKRFERGVCGCAHHAPFSREV